MVITTVQDLIEGHNRFVGTDLLLYEPFYMVITTFYWTLMNLKYSCKYDLTIFKNPDALSFGFFSYI